MALWAISDLHLAINSDKPMDIFGDKWSNHHVKIKKNWINKISPEDTVLIAGDISWSMHMSEGMDDLDWIHKLPGRKILIKGNHDYWWSGITKLNALYEDMNFIQNNFFNYNDVAICGTRGWNCPGSTKFSIHDEKIYNRELIRLRISLDAAVKSGYKKFIVMLHYPPTTDKFEETELISIVKEYNVSKVIYGHLHGPSLNRLYEGNIEGVDYIVTSCDYLNFDPLKILE
ncbi:metallophosphoesterase [Clostridium estertheticum]|uniref:Serine/threonine protein phosphatase n=2 Tax=Clostridium estertheticum TaxID=238834 RepID=A0A1J0GLD2_9CLOT|nr:metallophosphoesterase [Clostridium estertheticum]APC42113.1 serine/threonine protein phosphatase [Clostridium estertheticum subsp. estertheticum]MBU3184123.1 metallophosphoesterase [Clostridium estertheticum]MBW9170254.1 metallophosphoesterase [Clostridium estertheticum]NNU74774.1 serine/threonine protein phosphatase [Clostridium estertheticum]WBL47237.1 metallophosphoesterase [Clostridium estertheticum]